MTRHDVNNPEVLSNMLQIIPKKWYLYLQHDTTHSFYCDGGQQKHVDISTKNQSTVIFGRIISIEESIGLYL